MSDIQKMTYLKSPLRGSALSMISGLKLSNENYNAATPNCNPYGKSA